MEKMDLTQKKNITITPDESPGITLGTCITPGQTCGWSNAGGICGGSCQGIMCIPT